MNGHEATKQYHDERSTKMDANANRTKLRREIKRKPNTQMVLSQTGDGHEENKKRKIGSTVTALLVQVDASARDDGVT